MKIQIVPHSPASYEAVHEFNLRMSEGGSRWGFYCSNVCDWLPFKTGERVWREYHLAVDEEHKVRGAFALKPQPWLIGGQPQTLTDWQGPFSEGDIDKRYAAMGLRLIRSMLKLRPLLFSWGHGSGDAVILQMLEKLGWMLHPTPVCIYVNHPHRFLREATLLRSGPMRRVALEALAWSGIGWAGAKFAHQLLALKGNSNRRFGGATAEVEDHFGNWADELWERHSHAYTAIAVRDSGIMNRLLPTDGRWPQATRLYVGSIIDGFCHPSDADDVVGVATEALKAKGVDVIISNQTHSAWVSAFCGQGYAAVPGKRIFAASPQLTKLLAPWEQVSQGIHLTNLDGHGPHSM
jgi:hypothetical protein